MKFRPIALALALILPGASSLRADILILKNGDKKEGQILSETPDVVRMHYKLTKTIWDDKDFPRSEIAQIIKQTPQELELVELRKLLPSADLLTADGYEEIITDKLRPFLNKYPGTPEAKEVQDMIDTLQKEKEKVVTGQLKMEGAWLSPEVVKRDDYNIQAYKMLRDMRAAAGKDPREALRIFDQMSDSISGFPASVHYVTAVKEAIELLRQYEGIVTRMIADQPILQKQRDDSMKKMVEPQLSALKNAIDRETQTWKATYDAEKKSKVRWPSLYKYDIRSMQDTLRAVITERGKLTLIDLNKLQIQNEALGKALRYIADENVAEAENAMKEAAAVSMKEASRIVSQIRSKINDLRSQQAKNRTANRSFNSSSAAAQAAGAAIKDDKMAALIAEAEQEKLAKKEAAAAAAIAPKPEAPPEAPDAKEKSKVPSKAAPKPKSENAEDTSVTAIPADEGPGFATYMMIVAGILIVVLLVALVMQKKGGKVKE